MEGGADVRGGAGHCIVASRAGSTLVKQAGHVLQSALQGLRHKCLAAQQYNH